MWGAGGYILVSCAHSNNSWYLLLYELLSIYSLNKAMLGPTNVDLQTYFFTALPFLSENIKLRLISYIYVL
jgi:hypothetical protein